MSDAVRLLPLLLLAAVLGAAETAEEAVVTVNGESIPLAELEHELLRKEGAEAVVDLVERQLALTDWEQVADDDVVVAMPGWKLPRLMVAAALLDQHADRVREELINLMLVRQALAEAGLTIDEAMLASELATMRKRFATTLEEEGKPYVAFENFIKESQGVTLEEWVAQPGFKILAGVHHLLYERYPIPEAELRRFLRANYRDYVVEEGVDVSVIYMPYQTGSQAVDDRTRQTTLRLAQNFHRNIRTGRTSWEKVYALLNRGEPGDYGRKGWITRDGSAETKGQADVPRLVAARGFANLPSGDEPVLVDPIVHEHGVSLLRVHDHQQASKPRFEALRDRLQRDYIDSDLDTWTKRLMDELRRQADIDYRSLAELTGERKREARALAERLAAEAEE